MSDQAKTAGVVIAVFLALAAFVSSQRDSTYPDTDDLGPCSRGTPQNC